MVLAVDATTHVENPVSLTLHPHPQAVLTARRFVTSVFAERLDDARRDDLGVLVSELVSYAVVHAATTMELVTGMRGDLVCVELIDHSDREPRTRTDGDDSGYGLRIVAALARRWGVRHDACAKVVWFEM
jgi:sodium/proline symporter